VLNALTLSAFHHKALYVVIVFSLVDLSTICVHTCFYILHLHNPVAAQTDDLKISQKGSTSSRCTIPRSAASGGRPYLLSAVATRNV
jgi:hypothetical protein